MKLLTLNTHSLIEPDYEAKRKIFVDFIAREQPEVFALQEVNQTAAAPLLADPVQLRFGHDAQRRQLRHEFFARDHVVAPPSFFA